MVTIGIFGSFYDLNVLMLKEYIEKKGNKTKIINFSNFPKKSKLILNEKKIIFDDINLLKIDGYYNRQLGYLLPIVDKKYSRDEWMELYNVYNSYISNERQNILLKHSMIRILEKEKFVINPYASFIYHDIKPYQNYLLMKNGIRMPPFISGNDTNSLKNFWKENDAVCKPIGDFGYVENVEDFLLKKEYLLKQKPVIFQKYIAGDPIRAFVLDNQFISAGKVISGKNIDTKVDSKGYEKINIHEDIKEMAIKACNILGMHFSGIDLLHSKKEDCYYLLECNPDPNFYIYQKQVDDKFIKELVNYLINNSKK
jgi:glutathione synthase/RimK-type ligase-like ATP-grasp enzyme